jgi:hypothetical protein
MDIWNLESYRMGSADVLSGRMYSRKDTFSCFVLSAWVELVHGAWSE